MISSHQQRQPHQDFSPLFTSKQLLYHILRIYLTVLTLVTLGKKITHAELLVFPRELTSGRHLLDVDATSKMSTICHSFFLIFPCSISLLSQQ